MEIVSFLLYLRGKQMRYLTNPVVLNISENVAFAWETFVFWEVSLLILMSSVWTSDIFSLQTLEISIFAEDSHQNRHSGLANQSPIISCSSTTFWLVSQSNA